MQSSDYILTEAPPKADVRIAYGSDEFNFADLRLPHEKSKTSPSASHPIAMFIHGGYWRAKYDLVHAGHACAALARAGFAVWQIEYRRVGNPGGGWPGTFEDITSAYQFLYESHLSHDAVASYLGGAPDKVDEHYKEASPIEVPVPKVPQWLIHGTADDTVPIEISRHYLEVKKKWKENVHFKELLKTGHFELIDPKSTAWKTAERTVHALA